MKRLVSMLLVLCFGLYGTGTLWLAHMELSHTHAVTEVATAAGDTHSDHEQRGEERGEAEPCDVCDMLAAVRLTIDENSLYVGDVLSESGVVVVVDSLFVDMGDRLCWGARGPPVVA